MIHEIDEDEFLANKTESVNRIEVARSKLSDLKIEQLDSAQPSSYRKRSSILDSVRHSENNNGQFLTVGTPTNGASSSFMSNGEPRSATLKKYDIYLKKQEEKKSTFG